MVSLSTNEDDLFSVGGTQKGDPVKELMQTAFDCGRSGEERLAGIAALDTN